MHHLRALRVLGLAPGAAPDEIRMAWRDLAKVWHPDRFAHDERLQKKAGENLQRINAAYETLRDYDPATKPPVAARVRESVAIMFGIGDLGELPPSAVPPRPTPAAPGGVLAPSGPVSSRDSLRVLALGGHHRYSTRYKAQPERKRRRTLIVAAIILLIALAGAWIYFR